MKSIEQQYEEATKVKSMISQCGYILDRFPDDTIYRNLHKQIVTTIDLAENLQPTTYKNTSKI